MLKIKYKKIVFVFIFMGVSTLLFSDLVGTTYNGTENAFVKDSKTKLEWQNYFDFTSSYRTPRRTWPEAIEYCKNLDLNGTNWRLPNMKELTTIIDYSRYRPAVYPIFNTGSGYQIITYNFWSSTTDASQNLDPKAMVMNVEYGRSNTTGKDNYAYVRCVR